MGFLQHSVTHGKSAFRKPAAESQQHDHCYELKSASSAHESFRVGSGIWITASPRVAAILTDTVKWPNRSSRWTITTVPKQLGYQACRGKVLSVLSASHGPFTAECRKRIMCQATSDLGRVRWLCRDRRLQRNDKISANQRRKRSPKACFITWPPTSEMDFVSGISLGQTSTQFCA